MSQYTNARLLTDGDGNPIPQYLDVNDKTDSPQGTFKPLTGDPRQVQLTGSIPTQGGTAPKILLSVPFTEFVANGSYSKKISNIFTRNARQRYLWIWNSMDQPIVNNFFCPIDDGLPVPPGGEIIWVLNTKLTISSIPASNASNHATQVVVGSNDNPILGYAFTSATIILSMGATAPTYGEVAVFYSEVF